MTEIKKLTKIAILAYGIVSLIFAIMLIFFTEIFIATLNMPSWQNPAHPRMFGGAMLVVVIFAIAVLLHKDWEWEKIKFAYEVVYPWIPINMIIEISTLIIYSSILSSQAIMQTIMDLIIMTALLILGLFAYIKQRS
ncbi:MAG: hypothetical protein ACFFDY_13705 [Candidatus Thorarchaeota archaeon]